jgi:hypothetical protein
LELIVFLGAAGPSVWPSDGGDKDNYRFRVEGDWWFIHPKGDFGARSSNNYINFNEDFHFGDYSTFTGRFDWRFHRKHHFLLTASPVRLASTRTINRTIEFQGQTFDLGSQVQLKIKTFNFAPGHQYDVIRRDWGYLGFQINFNLLDTDATLNGVATVSGQTVAKTASKSLLAPLPAFGRLAGCIFCRTQTAFLSKVQQAGCTSSVTAASSRRERVLAWASLTDLRCATVTKWEAA